MNYISIRYVFTAFTPLLNSPSPLLTTVDFQQKYKREHKAEN